MTDRGNTPEQNRQPISETIQDISHNKLNKRRLPEFLDHFNARDLKILFRCWVAAWVACILIFINPSLTTFGTATFFACIIQLILPPSGIVLIYLLGALSLFIGICLAWTWGVIVMKAALAARPAAATEAQMLSLQQTAAQQANATGTPTASMAKQLVLEGYMLDARVTVITYCLICIFIYLMARLRASNPKTALTAIFAIIISDIFLLYIPLLPTFSGTIPLSLVKPAAAGVGLGLACSVLFFPQSTSHVVLNSMEDTIELLKVPLAFTSLALEDSEPGLDIAQLRKTKVKIIKEYKKMEPALAFLPLDFSIGYWNAHDVENLKGPIQQAVIAVLSLLDFHMTRISGKARVEVLLNKYMDNTRPERHEGKQLHDVGSHQLTQTAEFLHGLRNSDSEPVHMVTVNRLIEISARAIEVSFEGLSMAKECVHLVNCRRGFQRPSHSERVQLYQRSQGVLEELHQARNIFIHDMSETLITEYVPYTETHVEGDKARYIREFIASMIFEEQISNVIGKTETLLNTISTAFFESDKIRLWWPRGLKTAASWLFGKTNKVPTMAPVTDESPDEVADLTNAAQEKLRYSRAHHVEQRSPVGRAILVTYNWFTNNEGLYAIKMVIVTIALGCISAIPNTAGFFNRQKGLWGLIMGQTGLLIYMADFTFSVISRLVGTVSGGALGLLAWYIGAGSGPGNPYGLSAVLAVMLAALMWLRLYLPPNLLQGGIMGGSTFLIIVAYSYDDTHIPSYGNPGVGYTVFWRRLLLVLIGVAAATIVQIFPRPPSAAKHISKTLSKSVRTISDHYALLLTCWGRSKDEGRLLATPVSLQLAESFVMLDGPIKLLRFEFSSSRFDSKSLDQVKQLCQSLNRNIGHLLLLSGSLPQEYQEHLARDTGLLDKRVIGEVMAMLAVCEQVLKTGNSLPEILPSPLIQRSIENFKSRPAGFVLSPNTVRNENYRRFCVAVGAYLKFMGTIDELVLVLKGVVGEAHIVSRELVHVV